MLRKLIKQELKASTFFNTTISCNIESTALKPLLTIKLNILQKKDFKKSESLHCYKKILKSKCIAAININLFTTSKEKIYLVCEDSFTAFSIFLFKNISQGLRRYYYKYHFIIDLA